MQYITYPPEADRPPTNQSELGSTSAEGGETVKREELIYRYVASQCPIPCVGQWQAGCPASAPSPLRSEVRVLVTSALTYSICGLL